jgi:hypothetical protein
MPLTEEEKKKLDYINSKGGNIVKEGQKNAFESGKLTSSWVSGNQSRSDYSRMQNNIYEDKRNTASKRKSALKSDSSTYQDAAKKQQSLFDKVQKKQQQKAAVDSVSLSETPSKPQQTYQQQQNQVQTEPDKKNALSYLEQQTTGQQTTQQVRELQLKKAQRQADEQLKAAQNAQEDNETFLSDYDEISAMSPQEIQELEAYTTARDQGHSDNPLTEFYLQSKRKKTAGSLLEKYGQKRLDELSETYGRARHQQQEQQVQQKAKEDVSSVGGALTRSVGTVVTAPLQSAMSIKGRLDELSNRTGRYSTLEPFVPMDAARVYNNTVRSEVAQDIAGDGSNPLRKGAAVLYQVGIGTAGSLANAIVLGPGVGMAVNATNQFAQTVAEASAQGATPEQAYLYATANAAVDALTDKIPLDQLANVALSGNTNVFVNMLKQAGIEASNEGASILGSYIAEAAILKDSSQYSQSVEAYMDQALSQGMFETEKEARAWAERQADKDVLAQAEQQLLVAGISGGASGAVAAVKGNAAQKKLERQEKAAQAIQAEAERQHMEKTGGQMSMDQVQPQKTPLTPEDVQRQDQAITDTIDQVRDGQLGMEQLPDQPLQNPQQPEAQQPNTVSDIVEQMVRENQAQKMTPEQIQDIVQEAVSGGQGKAEEQSSEANTQPASTQDVANSESVRPDRKDRANPKRSIQQPQAAVSPEQAVQDTVQKMVEQKSTQAAQGQDKMVQDVTQNVVQNEAATPKQPTPEQLVQNAAEEATRAARGETVEPVASVGGGGATPPTDTLGMQNAPSGDTKKSRSVTNSGLNSQDPDIRAGYQQTLQQDPKAGDYQAKRNADTLSTAQQRTSTPERVRAEYDYLMQKQDSWTAEDAVTGRLVAKELFKSGDADRVTAMNKQLARVATNAGQVSQAFAITGTMRDAADPQSAVESATARIMAMKQENTTYDPGKSGQTFDQWKDSIAKEYTRLGMAVDNIPDGDTNAMRDVIRQIAKSRKTTAWFGTSDKLAANAERILKKLDFDTLKRIADTQIAAMPDDFRKRTKTEVAAGIRKQSMLSSLKTFGRNIAGNAATGFLDSASDSTTGYLVDSMLSKVTGKRTVGNDLARSKEYMNAAKDAADFASLCVELNVPIETDANAAFDSATAANRSGKFIGKTFRSNGNFMMRFLYGYQKYMSYALEVSDKVFEGGTNSAVTESLNRLKDSGLSDADVQQLAEYTANRRTFKDATWEEDGKVHGSNMSRVAQNIKNIGKGTDAEPFVSAATDVVMPFASVPMNVKQTGIDYKIGIAKGAYEICKIISDARHGKEINVARQRQAVSDFSRGTTGLVLTSIMTVAAGKGIIQVHDDSDKNKKAMEQSEGLSGAQFNWSAFSRSLDGGSEKWQSGDIVSSADFLEPFNDQMYLGAELAKDDAVREFLANPSFETVNPAMAKAWAKGSLLSTASSFLDSPMMDGLSQMSDLISSAVTAVGTGNADDVKNAAYEYAGSVASSFIPQFVRQAAQTKDGYYRDTRGEDSAEYAKNSVLNALPGASESLPKKINGFGEEQKRGGFVSNFLDPTNTQKLKLNEVSDDLAELSQSPDVSDIYPERQAPLTVKNAVGEEVRLTGEQRETYQKEYGEKASGYYKGLMGSKYFKALPDELKGDALQKAKEYAADSARASVTDYKATERGNTRTVVDEIVGEVVKTKATSTMTSLETAWKKGMDTSVAEKELSALYGTYGEQSETIQKAIMDAAEGNTKKYLEGRQSGLSSQKTLSALKSVQSVPAENRNKIGYQLQAISSTKGLSEEDMDVAMKLYMPDYDPSENEPNVTEVVYDYLRKEKGYSAEDYASFKYAYNLAASDYGDKNGKAKKDEYISAMLDMGYDQATAKEIFDTLWNGSSKRHKAIQQQALDLYG